MCVRPRRVISTTSAARPASLRRRFGEPVAAVLEAAARTVRWRRLVRAIVAGLRPMKFRVASAANAGRGFLQALVSAGHAAANTEALRLVAAIHQQAGDAGQRLLYGRPIATAWAFAAVDSLNRLAWSDLLSSLFLATLSLSAAISIKLKL